MRAELIDLKNENRVCGSPAMQGGNLVIRSSINETHTFMREDKSNVVDFSKFLGAHRVSLDLSVRLSVSKYSVLYRDRIEELEAAAKEENIESPNEVSLNYFFAFLDHFHFDVSRGALFLLDDGTCAAMWKNGKWRLDLTFNADGRVDCSCLDRGKNQPDGKTRQGSIQDIHDYISEHDLTSLFQ